MPSSCVAGTKEVGNFDNKDLMAAKTFAFWTRRNVFVHYMFMIHKKKLLELDTVSLVRGWEEDT